MLNNVSLVGRMTADPESAESNGTMRVGFALAVQRTYTPKGAEKQTDFIPIKVWGKTAELVAQYCHKGSLVGIEGSIQQRTYTDQSLKRHSFLEVNAEKVHFLDPKSANPDTPVSQGSNEDFSEIDETDDLPF